MFTSLCCTVFLDPRLQTNYLNYILRSLSTCNPQKSFKRTYQKNYDNIPSAITAEHVEIYEKFYTKLRVGL